ncbi:MAG: pyridoxal-phosphate dependent enzyme, partial [Gammaproteobacteria bacterium]|nr:pyridoxal-phosphate dependent enzyme [Gammaproteobacteria bacterium]
MNHKFEIFPRVPLIQQATPFLPLDRLTELFNVSLWVKRDDMNGVGAGGNKVRKLEYLLADAKQNNASAIITGGGI